MSESEFLYNGFECKVILTQMGHRCGYVRLPLGHWGRDMSYDDIDVDVHGGLTYGPDKDGWIGFDCAHCDDTPQIWTKEATEEETKKLAKEVSNCDIIKCVEHKLKWMPDWFVQHVTVSRKCNP